jgi:hypothetical protein
MQIREYLVILVPHLIYVPLWHFVETYRNGKPSLL